MSWLNKKKRFYSRAKLRNRIYIFYEEKRQLPCDLFVDLFEWKIPRIETVFLFAHLTFNDCLLKPVLFRIC